MRCSFVLDILSGIFLLYAVYCVYIFSEILFPEKCVPKPGSRRPSLACLRSELEADQYHNLQLRVYTSLSKRNSKLISEVLRIENFSMNTYYKELVEIPVPIKTRKNGSLWLHSFLMPPSNVTIPFSGEWHLVQTAKVTTYAPRKQEKYLLEATVNNSSEEYKEIVTHLRTKLVLRGVGEPFSFVMRKLPNEFSGIFKITDRNRYYPLFYVDYLAFTEDNLQEINVNSSRINITVIYHPTSVGHLRMLISVRDALRQMKEMGLGRIDIDMIVGILQEDHLGLLFFGFAVAMVHSVLDFLALKSDVSFWRGQKSMVGVSRRTQALRMFSEMVIFFYLINNKAGFLVWLPVFVGMLIDVWKLAKCFKFQIRRVGWRYECSFAEISSEESETDEIDKLGMKYLMYVMAPFSVIGAAYSLIYITHRSWYGWLLESLANAVYVIGFLLMLPQVFLNYKLKTVAHLPWKAFMYKAFNTFIDDIFAYIFKMPTSHRLACFRDDIVFLIYLYQRWLYPVDKRRTNEFGISYDDDPRKEKKCIICNQNCDVTEINRNLESSVLKYFLKPQDIVKNQMRDLSQVMEFQEFHRNSLVNHCRKLIKNFQMVNEKMKVESQKVISLEKSLKESLLENHRLKKEIESLKNEISVKSDFVYNKIATPSLTASGKSLYVRSSSPVVSQSSGRVQSNSTLGKRIALPCISVANSCLSSVESQSLTTPDILNVENNTASRKRTDSTQNRIPGSLTSDDQSSSILCENNQSRRSGLDSQYLHSVADSLKLPFPMQSIGNCQLWSRKAPQFKPSGRTL
ncbi:Cleft lip and palate transmembrane protein 1-like protein [Trichinella pseudospiralis]|uniref:Lipid scramblase CLPTM1L n=1 Tax=Trichinella pseudospiralis TaxID=6337 RepID=A0A0V0Y9Z6_TRIPS|nr:Cleft lip and palate transmembrane protein 1-like protein [Trichinella pseudospiralis]